MSRTVLALALLVLGTAGCGAAGRPHRTAAGGVPRALAQAWEDRASAIAAAAAAGDGCRALDLANSLRGDVVGSRRKLPLRLRSPLITGVDALADRITCTPAAPAPKPSAKKPSPAKKPPKGPKPKPPEPHDHDGHHGGGHGGDG